MRIALLVGYATRYFYLVKLLGEKHNICSIVVEKADLLKNVAKQDPYEDDILYKKHFELRDETEKKYYSEVNIDELLKKYPHYFVNKEMLNTLETVKYIRESEPDVIISFGVNYLKEEILNICPSSSYNFHNGLLPYYKGSSAHFWAFYFLEPTFVGCTFHRLTKKLDGGEIIHQCVGQMERGDGMHDLSCKSTMKMSQDICLLMDILKQDRNLEGIPQKKHGRMYVNKDFRPEHLRIIYEMYNNKLVDAFLDGKLNCEQPEIISRV